MDEEKENTIIINNGGYNGSIMEYSIGCVDITSISITPKKDWVQFKLPPDKDDNVVKMQVSENKTGEQREETFTVSYSIKGKTEPCTKSFTIVQKAKIEPEPFSCYRGTDNGTDYPTSGEKVSHPILLCGNIGSDDGDSIFVSGGLQYSLDNKATWHDFVTNGTEFEPTDWVKLTLGGNGCCGNPYINISTIKENTEETSTHYRTTTFWFRPKVYPTDGKVPECAGQGGCGGPAGKPLCTEWEYEIKQCQKGYFWCGEHSYNAVPVKCGEECSKVKLSCDCSEPSTCTCDDLKLTGKTISYEEKSKIQIGSFAVTCMTNIKATESSKDWVTNLLVDGTKIMADVAQNTTGAEREATITVTGKTETEDCSNTFKVKQQSATPTTCTCQEADVQVSEEIITLESTQGDNSFTDITYNCKPEIIINDGCDWLDVNLNETEGRLEFTSTKANLGNERTGYTYIKGGSETCLTITVKQKQTSQCKVPTGDIHIFLDASNFHYHNPDMYKYYITNDVIGINCERVLRNYSQGIGAPSENQPVSISHYEYNDCTFKFTFGGESYYEISSPGTECEVEAKDLSPGATYYLYVYNTLTSSFSQQGTFKMPTTEEAQEESLDKEIYIKI